MALNLRITFASVKWAGAAPALCVEHGPEQRRVPVSGAANVVLPYVPSKSNHIMAFDPLRRQDERAYLAGASIGAEQALQLPGGAAALELTDAAGAPRGRVQLRAELLPPAAPRHSVSPLLAGEPERPSSPFADPILQAARRSTGSLSQSLSKQLSSGSFERRTHSGQPLSSQASASSGGAPAAGGCPSDFSPLRSAQRRHDAALRAGNAAAEARMRAARAARAAEVAAAVPGAVQQRVSAIEGAAACAVAAPPPPREGGPESRHRARRTWQQAAPGACERGGGEAALYAELARQGAHRRAAGAQLLMAVAQQTAADARADAALISALGGGAGAAAPAPAPACATSPFGAFSAPSAGAEGDGRRTPLLGAGFDAGAAAPPPAAAAPFRHYPQIPSPSEGSHAGARAAAPGPGCGGVKAQAAAAAAERRPRGAPCAREGQARDPAGLAAGATPRTAMAAEILLSKTPSDEGSASEDGGCPNGGCCGRAGAARTAAGGPGPSARRPPLYPRVPPPAAPVAVERRAQPPPAAASTAAPGADAPVAAPPQGPCAAGGRAKAERGPVIHCIAAPACACAAAGASGACACGGALRWIEREGRFGRAPAPAAMPAQFPARRARGLEPPSAPAARLLVW